MDWRDEADFEAVEAVDAEEGNPKRLRTGSAGATESREACRCQTSARTLITRTTLTHILRQK